MPGFALRYWSTQYFNHFLVTRFRHEHFWEMKNKPKSQIFSYFRKNNISFTPLVCAPFHSLLKQQSVTKYKKYKLENRKWGENGKEEENNVFDLFSLLDFSPPLWQKRQGWRLSWRSGSTAVTDVGSAHFERVELDYRRQFRISAIITTIFDCTPDRQACSAIKSTKKVWVTRLLYRWKIERLI